ncbi:MAG: PQQ-binding-like beta-propeller repeat protein [Anaerolineae bacterium]|nr:PQQ-binding-like beta-propeller repeat protein [Anaerolineae bacterium]
MLRSLNIRPRHLLYGAAVLVAIILSSCAPLPGEGWANLTVSGSHIYVAYQEYVFRVDTSQGGIPNLDWVAKAQNNAHMYAVPAVAANGNVYVGAYDKQIYAFSPYAIPREQNISSWAPPVANDKYNGGALINDALGVLYVGHSDKGVYAYDLATGAQKAVFDGTRFGVWATPVLDAETNTLYVGSVDHYIYALNAETLELKWETQLTGSIYGTPLLANGTLYIGTFDGHLYSVNAETGEIKNDLKTDGGVWATPVLENDLLYFGDLKGTLFAVNPADLSVKYRVADDQSFGSIRGSVALATDQEGDRIVLVGSENKSLRAYRASDLSYKWGQQTEDRILSDLIVIGDDVIFTTMSNNQLLTGYNYNTRNRSWNIAKPTEDDLKRTASIRVEPPTPTVSGATATPEVTAEATPEATAAVTAEATEAATATAAATSEATPAQ